MTGQKPLLELDDIGRLYGRKVALDGISLGIPAGEIVCLLGPNGAGKTTTVRIASTLLTPSRGSVRIAGVDAVRRPRQARVHLGLVLGGDRGFYMRATLLDNLRFFAEIRGVAGRRREEQIRSALERVNLSDRADRPVDELSRGMRQRLHIARALIGTPSVVLFDEPSSGLDPESAMALRNVVLELRAEGAAILLTTHHMQEAEALADRVVLIDRGVIAAEGSTEDIARAAGIPLVSTFRASTTDAHILDRIRGEIAGVVEVLPEERNGAWTIDVMWSSLTPDNDRVVRLLGSDVQHVVTRDASLEEAYLGFLRRHRDLPEHRS